MFHINDEITSCAVSSEKDIEKYKDIFFRKRMAPRKTG